MEPMPGTWTVPSQKDPGRRRSVLVPEPVLGYLGPEGSHSEAAADRLRVLWPALGLSPEPTLDRMAAAVVAGRLDGAVVPVENSIEGSVDRVLDLLAEEPELSVR